MQQTRHVWVIESIKSTETFELFRLLVFMTKVDAFLLGKTVQRLVDITQPSKDLASVIRSSKVLPPHTFWQDERHLILWALILHASSIKTDCILSFASYRSVGGIRWRSPCFESVWFTGQMPRSGPSEAHCRVRCTETSIFYSSLNGGTLYGLPPCSVFNIVLHLFKMFFSKEINVLWK